MKKLRKIQKVVKSWLKNNKYKRLHKSANTLIEKIKELCEGSEGKEFLKKKKNISFYSI